VGDSLEVSTLLAILLVLVLVLIKPAWLTRSLTRLVSILPASRKSNGHKASILSFVVVVLPFFSDQWFIYLPAGSIALAVVISLMLGSADANNAFARYVIVAPISVLAALIYGLLMTEAGPWTPKLWESLLFLVMAAIFALAGVFILVSLTKALRFRQGRW
jgi:hypothetical protein